jgi:hypothetical protein
MLKDRQHRENRFQDMREEENIEIKKVFLADKALLIYSSNIEIYGIILDIESYWLKVQNAREEEGRQSKKYEKYIQKKKMIELMIHACQLME